MIKDLKIAVIAGEESGDILAADFVRAARRQYGGTIKLIGVGGQNLASVGLDSLFPMEEISLMGLAQILKKLPRLVYLIRQTAAQIIAAKPDCLIVVDAPDFTHRVAARVRAKLPHLPIIQYVAPSVWAWREHRARHMRRFIDHLLVVLPFEVDSLRALDGPASTYVGHPLLFDEGLNQARLAQRQRRNIGEESPLLVVLPGSRRSEIRALMAPFGETVGLLQQRLPDLHVTLPTLPFLADEVRLLAQGWPCQPDIVTTREEKIQAFARAGAALAASGTVSLELALAQVPMVLCYKADWFAKQFILPKITIWSASLPNIITDMPIVPEYYNEFIRPALIARQLHRHMVAGSARDAQCQGLASLLQKMQYPLEQERDSKIAHSALDMPANAQTSSGTLAAKIVLDLIARKQC